MNPGKKDTDIDRWSLARLSRAVMAGLGLGLVVTAIHTCVMFLPGRMSKADFAHFYLSASLLRHGSDVYSVPLKEYAREIHFPAEDLMEWEGIPPPLVWLLRPLAAVPIAAAFWSYVAVEVASLVVVFISAWRFIPKQLSTAAWILALGLTLFSYPVLYHLWLSQVQLPLLASLMIGYGLWRRGRSGWATVIFALAGVAKLFPLVFLPLPALAERGRARLQLFVLAFASAVGFAMLPGTAAWVSFFQHAIPFLRTIAERVRSNYTLPFLIGRVSESVFSAAWAVMAVEIATTIALSGFAWWCCSRLSWSKAAVNKDSAFCLLLVTSLLASAIAWAHYFVFMIYPLLRLAAEAGPARGRQRAWLVALVVASLAAFNLADAEPGSMSLRCLSVAANKAPVFVLGLLYLRFARQTSSDTLVKCGHEPRRASASNPSLSE